METRIATSIEQSKKLIELGIDINTADMDYVPFVNDPTEYDCVINEWNNEHEEDWIPAWSLSALLELMPERIKIGEELSFCLTLKKSSTGFSFGYNLNGSIFVKDNPLDSAFEMICWLKENGKI